MINMDTIELDLDVLKIKVVPWVGQIWGIEIAQPLTGIIIAAGITSNNEAYCRLLALAGTIDHNSAKFSTEDYLDYIEETIGIDLMREPS